MHASAHSSCNCCEAHLKLASVDGDDWCETSFKYTHIRLPSLGWSLVLNITIGCITETGSMNAAPFSVTSL